LVRFLHTADWQIGKPFARVIDLEKRAQLKQMRIAAIARLADLAKREQLAFVLVAGDLFDSPGPTRAELSQACSAIATIAVPVFVIPGNHDHGGPDSLWHQDWFQACAAELAPNLQVLLERRPLPVEGALLLPCPLLRQAESLDPTAWVRQLDPDQLPPSPRILLAHGSVHGFAAAEECEADGEAWAGDSNRIDLSAIPDGLVDYAALGDWHGLKQVGEASWYCGCPEQDRFPRAEGYRSGQVLLVDLERGKPPQVRVEPTGMAGWHQLQHRFQGDGDLERLELALQRCLGGRSGSDLLLLELEGNLSLEASTRLNDLLERLEARLLRLKLRNSTTLAPSEAELAELVQRPGDPLVARVGLILQEQSQNTTAEAQLARLALRELYSLCRGEG
jgi:DNA repair exonuclease SbcCD nuclease subunit